ncbi:UV excision repair protein RAD23 homolog A [Melitaea cinxia]|uniref:UV excision repair protein RAD23 homolog A n=1 Tax=Melitaea cinxia TaxID=113334 RepID=UPI001E27094A|nr:UV excision repair protein RAD23 homolog A [Melitaea cinxia]
MLVTLKTLQQQTFQIEIDPDETVKALKLKIEVEKGKDYAADHQKLIYAGKILLDDNKLRTYNIDEKKFIVIMVTKPKSSDNPQTSSASAPASAENASTESGDGKDKNVEEKPKPAPETEPERAAEPPIQSNELDFESTVQSIMDMGYNRQQVEQALRASFNNRERAVEYLITGIPEELLQEQEAEESSDDDPLGFLRDQPQFQQMRAVIQQNPNLLNTVLQQIGQTNPALLQAISQHQQAFVRMLNEPVNTPPTAAAAAAAAAAAIAPDEISVENQPPQSQNVIQISPQDKEAIERLKALGFPEHMVIQAYFACEKNENLAANFLLSQNFDD